MRRTPLKRGDSVLKSNKPLRKRSKKTEEKYVERRKIVSQMLEANKECVACKVYHTYDTVVWSFPVGHPLSNVRARRTVDIHELINRSQGGSILDGRNLLAVCRECHTRITTEPKEAERLGLTIYHIGEFTEDEKGVVIKDSRFENLDLPKEGFEHFKTIA